MLYSLSHVNCTLLNVVYTPSKLSEVYELIFVYIVFIANTVLHAIADSRMTICVVTLPASVVLIKV